VAPIQAAKAVAELGCKAAMRGAFLMSVAMNVAFGGKADMVFCGISLSRSLLGVKRTSLFAAQMSAYDPKRQTYPPA
jgi:hypothetical protein